MRPTLTPLDEEPGDTARPTIGPGDDQGYASGSTLRPTLAPSDDDNTLRPTLAGDELRPTLGGNELRPTLAGDEMRPTLGGETLRPTLGGESLLPDIDTLRPTLAPSDGDTLRPTLAGQTLRPTLGPGEGGRSTLPPMVSSQADVRLTSTSSQSDASDSGEEGKGTKSDAAISFVRRRDRQGSSMSAAGTVEVQARAGLSRKQVQELRDVFALFDPEGLNMVAPSLIRDCACEARLDADNPEVWSMLEPLEGDEPVDFTEFLALVTHPLGDRFSKAGAQRMMGLIGDDPSSFGLEDLTRVAEELGIELSQEELTDLIDKAGGDDEDRLHLDDFYDVIKPPSEQGSDSEEEDD